MESNDSYASWMKKFKKKKKKNLEETSKIFNVASVE